MGNPMSSAGGAYRARKRQSSRSLPQPRQEHFASITEVSRTSVRVASAVLPPVGERLTFRSLGAQVRGEVVRSEGQVRAIQFEMPITLPRCTNVGVRPRKLADKSMAQKALPVASRRNSWATKSSLTSFSPNSGDRSADAASSLQTSSRLALIEASDRSWLSTSSAISGDKPRSEASAASTCCCPL